MELTQGIMDQDSIVILNLQRPPKSYGPWTLSKQSTENITLFLGCLFLAMWEERWVFSLDFHSYPLQNGLRRDSKGFWHDPVQGNWISCHRLLKSTNIISKQSNGYKITFSLNDGKNWTFSDSEMWRIRAGTWPQDQLCQAHAQTLDRDPVPNANGREITHSRELSTINIWEWKDDTFLL